MSLTIPLTMPDDQNHRQDFELHSRNCVACRSRLSLTILTMPDDQKMHRQALLSNVVNGLRSILTILTMTPTQRGKKAENGNMIPHNDILGLGVGPIVMIISRAVFGPF